MAKKEKNEILLNKKKCCDLRIFNMNVLENSN